MDERRDENVEIVIGKTTNQLNQQRRIGFYLIMTQQPVVAPFHALFYHLAGRPLAAVVDGKHLGEFKAEPKATFRAEKAWLLLGDMGVQDRRSCLAASSVLCLSRLSLVNGSKRSCCDGPLIPGTLS